MNVVSGPGSKPGTHLCCLMGAVVIHDQVNIQIFWNLPVNRIQKGQKLFGPVPPALPVCQPQSIHPVYELT